MLKKIITAVVLVLVVLSMTTCTDSTTPEANTAVSASDASTISGLPSFSLPAGFYSENITLEILGSDDLTIRYTTDGTEPTCDSPIYKSPIVISDRSSEKNDISTITGISTTGDFVPYEKISKGTVIRAALFSEDGTRGDIATATYFVGLDYGDALVVSIVTDRDGLFDYEKGIFMLGKRFDEWKKEVGSDFSNYGDWEYQGNFSLKGDEWEREINIEFFENGKLRYSQIAGMRVAGAATRTYRQKSLRITAREQYGDKNFKFPLIPENTKDGYPDSAVTKYRNFVLRNGGNDGDYARIRDPFIQSAVADCSFSTQQTRPAVAFINGEYWGVYTITEDYNERYIEENYGVDKDNVAILKRGTLEEGTEEALELFYDVHAFITGNDMSIAENYYAACSMLDMTGFAQYCALHLYIGSEDGPFEDNNWRMWRTISTSDKPYEDGMLRIMLYDTEFSMGLYDSGRNYEDNTFETLCGNQTFCGSIFNSLMSNSQFKSLFVDEFLNMRNVRFSPQNVAVMVNALHDEYKDLMPEHYARFGPSWINKFNDKERFKGSTQKIINYLEGRYEVSPVLLCNYLDLDPNTAIVTESDGSISIKL